MKVYLAFNSNESTSNVRLGDLGYLRRFYVQNKHFHGETLTATVIADIWQAYQKMYVTMPSDALLLTPDALFEALAENRGKSVWWWTS